jgi:hypothetical protein
MMILPSTAGAKVTVIEDAGAQTINAWASECQQDRQMKQDKF